MSTYNPYQKQFPRGQILQPFAGHKLVHPINRVGHEAFYKSANPHGYHHDLGAQDVFLDNLGVLYMEQFIDTAHYNNRCRVLGHLVSIWDLLGFQTVFKSPWWGSNLNAKTRRANSGEPRSLLRFLGQEDLSHAPSRLLDIFSSRRGLGISSVRSRRAINNPALNEPLDPSGLEDPWQILNGNDYQWWRNARRFGNWDPGPLEPPDWDPGRNSITDKDVHPYPHGADLPTGTPPHVDTVRILHPDQSTPDLPARVGTSKSDQNVFHLSAMDQGAHPTCVANAICTALNILVRRQFKGVRKDFNFSSAWMHCLSGNDSGRRWDQGRETQKSIELLGQGLPCREKAFPYAQGESDMNKGTWETGPRMRDSHDLTHRYGIPTIRELENDAVADMKAHLAAGWVIVVSTSITENFRSPGLNRHGLPLTPFLGEKRLAGHAWCLVGYNHVDGNAQWKHQGRFIALNTWGLDWPHKQVLGQGLCHLPFSMFLTECHGVWALRFPFGNSPDSYQSETPIA
jgi:hypothetical protein